MVGVVWWAQNAEFPLGVDVCQIDVAYLYLAALYPAILSIMSISLLAGSYMTKRAN